jgi:hypothetical protein
MLVEVSLFVFCIHYEIFNYIGGLTRGSRRERIIGKFTENEFEKVDRLMELYMRYLLLDISCDLEEHYLQAFTSLINDKCVYICLQVH